MIKVTKRNQRNKINKNYSQCKLHQGQIGQSELNLTLLYTKNNNNLFS